MRFSLLALLILITGCQIAQVAKEAVAPRATAYSLIVKPWHRYSVLKEDFTSILASVDAVYLSCDLRSSILEYRKTMGVLTEAETEELLKRELSICRAYYEFIVALYTKKSEWNNLGSDNSYFRVFLVAKDVKRPPELIEPVILKDDEIASLYPFVEPWMKVYKIRFGRAGLEDASDLTLEFVSLSGRMELSWHLH